MRGIAEGTPPTIGIKKPSVAPPPNMAEEVGETGASLTCPACGEKIRCELTQDTPEESTESPDALAG